MTSHLYAPTKHGLSRTKELLTDLQENYSGDKVAALQKDVSRMRVLFAVLRAEKKKHVSTEALESFGALYHKCAELMIPHRVASALEILGEDFAPVRGIELPSANGKVADLQAQIPDFLSFIESQEGEIIVRAKNVKKRAIRGYLKKRTRRLRKLLYPRLQRPALAEAQNLAREIVFLSGLLNGKHQRFYKKTATLIRDWQDKANVLQYLESGRQLPAEALAEMHVQSGKDLKELRKYVKRFYKD